MHSFRHIKAVTAASLIAATLLTACSSGNNEPSVTVVSYSIPSDQTTPIITTEQTSDTSASESSSDTTETTESTPEVTDPDMTGVTVKKLDSLVIVGDTGYEYYNFVQSLADKYVETMNRAGKLLAGKADVYTIIIPTSIDITLAASVRETIKVADQRTALDYMYGNIEGVKEVDIFDTLRQHRNEYIYFRNDHHWTAKGAWYAYLQFAEMRGRGHADLEKDFTIKEFDNFLGSFYRDSNKSKLLNNPDTVTAYVPVATNKIEIMQKDGTPLENWHVVQDVSTWAASSKYNTFIGGDQPWSVITNPTKNDGSACLIIKDSFGNAFTPFLVPDYQYVYIVDYRYYKQISSLKLSQVVDKYHIQDVIFCNNISSTRNRTLVPALDEFVQ